MSVRFLSLVLTAVLTSSAQALPLDLKTVTFVTASTPLVGGAPRLRKRLSQVYLRPFFGLAAVIVAAADALARAASRHEIQIPAAPLTLRHRAQSQISRSHTRHSGIGTTIGSPVIAP